MKLLGYGPAGREKPGVLDGDSPTCSTADIHQSDNRAHTGPYEEVMPPR